MTVSKERGENRQLPFDIRAPAVPTEQCMNSKPVAQVVHSWIPARGGVLDARGMAYCSKGRVQRGSADGSTPLADEKGGYVGFTGEGISTGRIRGKCGSRCGINRHQTGLAELGVANREQALRQIQGVRQICG